MRFTHTTTLNDRFYPLSGSGSISDSFNHPLSASMSQLPTPNKPLPTIPRLSTLLSPVAEWEDENDVGFLFSPNSPDRLSMTAISDTTKRDYALLELLDSERTYASDLILIRDYQIPLASGMFLLPSTKGR